MHGIVNYLRFDSWYRISIPKKAKNIKDTIIKYNEVFNEYKEKK